MTLKIFIEHEKIPYKNNVKILMVSFTVYMVNLLLILGLLMAIIFPVIFKTVFICMIIKMLC